MPGPDARETLRPRNSSDAIVPVLPEDLPRVLEIWETALLATLRFLGEAQAPRLVSLIDVEVLDALDLACMRDEEDRVVGFVGVSEGKIELLFVDPEWHARGVGRRLVEHAIRKRGARLVDVNERDEVAIRFYRKMGFEVFERSAEDALGLPIPLVHMRLAKKRARRTGPRSAR